jgi:hypothetical protein
MGTEEVGTRALRHDVDAQEERLAVVEAVSGATAFPIFLAANFPTVMDAVTEAATRGGGTVLLPIGPTELDASEAIALLSNVGLEGSGCNESVLKSKGPQSFTLLRNLRASLTSGPLDSNLTIRNLTFDGGSTGVEADGRKGYGLELYGVENFIASNLFFKDMPLSAFEISGDIAAIANGVRTATEPLLTSNGLVSDIRIDGAGWQIQYLTEEEKKVPWGDAGFGLIIRAGARDIDVRGVITTDTYYGGFGIGQLSNVNSSATPFPNKAQAGSITASGIHVNQTTARGTPGAPSIRVSFAYDVSITNWSARGNAGSQGFAIRQAGSTGPMGIRVSDGWSEGNEFGLIHDGASSTVTAQRVSITGVMCVSNRKDGFYVEDPFLEATSCHAWGNARHNWNFQSPEPGVLRRMHATLTGCTGLDANGGEGVTSECGLQLKDCANVKVIGGDYRDSREGAERTQNYGIREVGVADENTIIGVGVANNITGQIVTLGANTLVFDREHGPSLPFRPLYSTQGQATTAAAAATTYFFIPSVQNASAPVPGNTNSPVEIFRVVAADLAVVGKTTTLRINAECSVIGTSPAVKVTVSLAALKLESGKYVPGTVVEGSSIELELTGKTNAFVQGSKDIAVPADGRYCLVYTVSGTPAANFKLDGQISAKNA